MSDTILNLALEVSKEAIRKIIKEREDELSSCGEFNNFTEEQYEKYDEKTQSYRDCLTALDKSSFIDKADYLRLAADFDNYKKRTAKAEINAYDRGSKDAILALLSVYDDLERTLKATKCRHNDDADVDPIHSGVCIALENFEKILASFECRKIDCKLGDKFDVNYHEAICSRLIVDGEYDENDICEIYQSGWMHNGKLLRPVKVIVNAMSV